MFDTCDYFDINSFNDSFPSRINILFVIHLNIRILQKNIDRLSDYIYTLDKQPDIIALSETKLEPDTMNSNIDLDGCASILSDSAAYSGGIGMYIQRILNLCDKRNLYYDLPLIEETWINLETIFGPIAIAVFYRHPVDIKK